MQGNSELRLALALKYNIQKRVRFKDAKRLRTELPKVVELVREHRLLLYEDKEHGPFGEFYSKTVLDVLVEYELDPASIEYEACGLTWTKSYLDE